VPMNCGVRSLVTLSPTIPVSLAGLRRKSVTWAGVVLSIRNVTVLLVVVPRLGYWVYAAWT
jgi:hypothetical protein